MLMYLSIYLLIKKIVDIYDSSRITQIVPHNIHIYTQEKIVGENSSDGLEKSWRKKLKLALKSKFNPYLDDSEYVYPKNSILGNDPPYTRK